MSTTRPRAARWCDADLRTLAASGMHKLVTRLAEDLDSIVGDLGEDAATVTVGELLAEGASRG